MPLNRKAPWGGRQRPRNPNVDRKDTAANIVATEVFLYEMPTDEHEVKVTPGLEAELKCAPALSIVEAAREHLAAFFGLQRRTDHRVALGEFIDLSGDGRAAEPKAGAKAPAASATSSVQLLAYLTKLATVDSSSTDLFARLDAIREGLRRLTREVRHVDRMQQSLPFSGWATFCSTFNITDSTQIVTQL